MTGPPARCRASVMPLSTTIVALEDGIFCWGTADYVPGSIAWVGGREEWKMA